VSRGVNLQIINSGHYGSKSGLPRASIEIQTLVVGHGPRRVQVRAQLHAGLAAHHGGRPHLQREPQWRRHRTLLCVRWPRRHRGGEILRASLRGNSAQKLKFPSEAVCRCPRGNFPRDGLIAPTKCGRAILDMLGVPACNDAA
jgi:hypothetical protein